MRQVEGRFERNWDDTGEGDGDVGDGDDAGKRMGVENERENRRK